MLSAGLELGVLFYERKGERWERDLIDITFFLVVWNYDDVGCWGMLGCSGFEYFEWESLVWTHYADGL